jgi:hypothetical protein
MVTMEYGSHEFFYHTFIWEIVVSNFSKYSIGLALMVVVFHFQSTCIQINIIANANDTNVLVVIPSLKK